MPIYEYQCAECGELHEALRKISDPPLTDCPSCGKPALRKKVSAAAFRLAGGGWYETDFKSGNKRNLAGDSASESGSGSSDKKDGGEKAGGDKSAGAEKKDSKPAKADAKPGNSAA